MSDRETAALLNSTPGGLTKAELTRVVIAQRAYMDAVQSGTPFQKQRAAANFFATRVLEELIGPDGMGGPGSLLHSWLEAAKGAEYVARCKTSKCENNGLPIVCSACGEAAIIRSRPNYSAADALLKYLLPLASANEAVVKDEFLEWVGEQAIRSFDAANQLKTAAGRRDKFLDGLRHAFAESQQSA